MILFSSQSRSGWYFVLGMILLMVVLQFIGPESVRYENSWWPNGDLWRPIFAHWVHVNWVHFGLNVAGLVLCLSLTSPVWSIRRWFIYQLMLGLGISLLFTWFNPDLIWYVGYSGILYGLFILAAVDLIPRDRIVALLLIGAIVIKISIEQSGPLNLTTSDIIGSPVVVDAHLYGVLLAIAIALLDRAITIVKGA